MAILGIDEVGRGPWAGPLVVGAVVLPDDFDTAGLTDSKKLTAKQRANFQQSIVSASENHIGLGWVYAPELDTVGLSTALKLATRRAVEQVKSPFHEIIIDGTVNFLSGTKLERHVTVLKKADFLIPAVSAASIVAKVARDAYMIGLDSRYPGYGFASHVGYGTAQHQKALQDLGKTPEHRNSFRPIQEVKNTTAVGNLAESKVAAQLADAGHIILARNWRTKLAEIDIISTKGEEIYFTEVKYRKNHDFGGGLGAIDTGKLRKMQLGAQIFCQNHCIKRQPIFLAASVSAPYFRVEQIIKI